MSIDAGNVQVADLFRVTAAGPAPGGCDAPTSSPARPRPRPIEHRRMSPGGGVFIVLFGVVLPAATLLVELFTRMCTTTLFDPIPTPLHVALVAAVPIANAAVWWATRDPRKTPRHLTLLGMLNGVAIGSGLCYTLAFVPVLPFAMIALVFFGAGLLPMGPLFGLLAAAKCRDRLRCPEANYDGRQVAGLWPGVLVAVAVLVGSLAIGLVTDHGLLRATSADQLTREDGIRFLRTWGSEKDLLAACYWGSRGGLYADFNGRVDVDAARAVFYRVTGASFDAHPSPTSARAGWLNDADARDGDEELRGGERVGGVLPGLSVASSRIDGSVNADAATAYFEWTVEFKNDQPFAQEARCRVALPPGGVVSRLTLWINGEEREAAFGGRAQVREAYEQVVRVQRRDPVLVTQAGPDRVQMQCFPVPPGGLMKTRIGITAPVRLTSPLAGTVRLPSFVDRNFAVPSSLGHTLWIESRSALSANGAANLAFSPAGAAGNGSSALTGQVRDEQLQSRLSLAVARRADAPAAVAFDDPYDKAVGTVVQRIEPYAAPPPAKVVIAVDASASMADVVPAVADALAGLPAGVAASAVVSRDGLDVIEGDPATVAARLREVRCVGGQDAVPAVVKAWDLAAGHPNAVVLWVHGPQPALLDSIDGVSQRVERAATRPRLLHLQAVAGTNEVLERLADVVRLEPVPATGSVAQDLAGLFGDWRQSTQQWRFVRTAGPAPAGETTAVAAGDIQIVRLWALEQVLDMSVRPALGEGVRHDEATALAVRHHLVTPVSGAVVLENQQQYDAAGLSPVTAIPLPPALWVILAMIPLVWWVTRKSRTFAPR